jgi:hypothetical protein
MQAKNFFFEGMMQGYAVSEKKIKIAKLPGYKAIPFRDGDFSLLDLYCVTPNSNKSAGTTTIWFQEEPVWIMQYSGYYEESAIKFLKTALCKAYEMRHFVGDRGPVSYKENLFIYTNSPRRNNFTKFEGREEIFVNTADGQVSLGFHEYSGMSLV